MPIPSRHLIKRDLLILLKSEGAVFPVQVYETLATKWKLTSHERQKIRSGDFLFKHEIRWAKQEMVIEGLVARKKQGSRSPWVLQELQPAWNHPEELRGKLRTEGTKKNVTVNKYERDPNARRDCLKIHGYLCKACGFDFEKNYGALGKECIYVHHIVPISSIGKEYVVDPENDLIPVCPNCHYMMHRREPPFSVTEIKALIRVSRKKTHQ